MPTNDKIWIVFIKFDKLNAVKFHGKPVKIVPLIYSKKENIIIKSNIDEKLVFSLK